MAALTDLFCEWEDRQAGRRSIEIARDILALAGEQRPGQVIVRDDLVENPIIREISRRIIVANGFLRGDYGNPVSPGVVRGGAGQPLFCEDLRMAQRASDIEWASLPLPS